MVLNISNDEPAVMGETDEQRQLCEQRNADRAVAWKQKKRSVEGDPDQEI
jgi:hypothetical protein